jgi:hypothetical protein
MSHEIETIRAESAAAEGADGEVEEADPASPWSSMLSPTHVPCETRVLAVPTSSSSQK